MRGVEVTARCGGTAASQSAFPPPSSGISLGCSFFEGGGEKIVSSAANALTPADTSLIVFRLLSAHQQGPQPREGA